MDYQKNRRAGKPGRTAVTPANFGTVTSMPSAANGHEQDRELREQLQGIEPGVSEPGDNELEIHA